MTVIEPTAAELESQRDNAIAQAQTDLATAMRDLEAAEARLRALGVRLSVNCVLGTGGLLRMRRDS
jgi:hypothetical protein